MSIEERLKDVEGEIASIRKDLAKEVEDFPVGTVLQALTFNHPLAIHMGSIFGHGKSRGHTPSVQPVWVTIFSDFSGSSYPTLSELRKARDEFREYKVLRRGGFHNHE